MIGADNSGGDKAGGGAWRRWLLVPAFGLLGAGLGFGFAQIATPHYLSAVRVDLGTGDAAAMGGVAPYLETQQRLLVTRTQARRVARAFRLEGDTAFVSAFGGSADESAAARALADAVEVFPVGGSTLVDVAVQTPDPALSARLANRWVREFIRARAEREAGDGAEGRKALDAELATQRGKLAEAEKALFDFAQATGIVAPDLLSSAAAAGADGGDTAARSPAAAGEASSPAPAIAAPVAAPGADVAALKEALSRATITRIEAETALSTPDPDTARAVARLQASLSDAERELAEMRANFDAAYPPIAEKRKEIAQIERAISAARNGNRGQLEAARADAVRRESALRTQLAAAEQSFFTQQQGRVQYATLARAAQEERKLYEALAERRRELTVQASAGAGIEIISRARPALSPHWPSGWRTALLGGAIGLGIALLVAGTRQMLARRRNQRKGWKTWRPR